METELSDAFEVVVAGRGDASILLTCEHATEHMPAPWHWHPEDAWLRGTHWAYDLGAAPLTRDLAVAWNATAVLSRFTRLLIDPNRPESSRELFRATAEGQHVAMNAGIEEADRRRRVELLWRPYHAAVDRAAARTQADILFAVHSFTPVYEGEPRHLEVGVLYDQDEMLARRVHDTLGEAGFAVALNEPYSGAEGFMYSVDRHARAYGRRSLELEVRQDLAVDDAFRGRLVDALSVLKLL